MKSNWSTWHFSRQGSAAGLPQTRTASRKRHTIFGKEHKKCLTCRLGCRGPTQPERDGQNFKWRYMLTKRVHNSDVSWHVSFALVSIIIHYCSYIGRGEGNGYSWQLPTSAGCIGRGNGIRGQRHGILGWRKLSLNNWANKKKKLQRKQISETQWNEEM
jgi:hypothetical protein